MILSQKIDFIGNSVSQLRTTNNTPEIAISLDFKEKEGGIIVVYYVAVNESTGAVNCRTRTYVFKKVNGAITSPANTDGASYNDAGMTTSLSASVVNGKLQLSVTGLSSTNVLHTVKTMKISNELL